MSNLNFSKWNLNEKTKRTNRKSIRNTSILREQFDGENLGFRKSKYGRDLDPKWLEDEDMEGNEFWSNIIDLYRDEDNEYLYKTKIENDEYSNQPDVTVVDDPYDAGMFETDEQDNNDRTLAGLEGPFSFKRGELYYDPKEGKYYDRGTDMYLDHDESTKWTMGESKGYLSEMPYGTDDEKESEETIIPIEDISTIAFDFARSWYDGMWDPLYRIGSSGKMYVSDIDYVESEIQSAIESDEGEDPEWSEILMMAEDEIDSLKRKYGSGLLESDDLDFDF